MKIHPVIPRKALKRSYDCVDGDLVNIITLTPTLVIKASIWPPLERLGAAPMALKMTHLSPVVRSHCFLLQQCKPVQTTVTISILQVKGSDHWR